MRRLAKRVKKVPSDYPVLGFRVPEDKDTGETAESVKNRLSAEIERVVRLFENKTVGGGYAWNRNRIIVKALEIGLKSLQGKFPK